MIRLQATIVVFLFALSTGRAQWLEQQIPPGISFLSSIQMLDQLRGYACGGAGNLGASIFTTNGGATWSFSQLPDSLSWFYTAHLLPTGISFAVATRFQFGPGVIVKSTDVGRQWSIVQSNQSVPHLLGFLNDSVGFGTDGGFIPPYANILRTQDGCVSWDSVYTVDSVIALRKVVFDRTGAIGIAIGDIYGNGGAILRTTDTGTTWSRQDFFDVAYFIDVTRSDSLIWYVVGPSKTLQLSVIYKTIDAGASWTRLSYEPPARIYGVTFAFGSHAGIIFGSRYKKGDYPFVARTTDEGLTWQGGEIDSVRASVTNAQLVTASEGFLCGVREEGIWDSAFVMHTTNGGVTFVPDKQFMPRRTKLHPNYPNPFNPNTTISFEISHADRVTLHLYDLLGRMVFSVFDGECERGFHSIDFAASDLASGIYVYRLQTSHQSISRKMCLIR